MDNTNQPSAMELLPCPFCGGEANADGHTRYSHPLSDTWWADGTEISETFFVNCMKCGTRSRGGLCDGYQTQAEAITAWNTRADRHLTPSEPGWRDIATAPKDGDVVLLYHPNEPMVGEYLLAGYWGEWPGVGEDWIAAGGKPLGYHSQVTGTPQGYPTHWMPLPAAPGSTPPAPANSDAIPELSLPYELKALGTDDVVSDAGLVERIDYILDPSVSASERMQRRSHLTNHDLRTIRAAISAIPTPACELGTLSEGEC